MTDLSKFVEDAIRTESRIDYVEANDRLLEGAIRGFIAFGNILDILKKDIYYGKGIDSQKLHQHAASALLASMQVDPNENAGDVLTGKMVFDVDPRLFHAIVGIATESTELVEALDTALRTNEADVVNVLEELGDINWYQAIALDTLDGDFDSVLNTVIAKLKARYPEKFTSEDAINRDLATERKILEG